ncbi:MAG: GNAT family N-acetyltransferase [Alphaproteobacteria bacterium]
MRCEIEWNSLSPAKWEENFAKVRRSNILQSYDYARAMAPLHKQKGRWGLIKMDDKEAGLIQILEAGALGNLIHAATLDRGPLWFDGFGGKDDFKDFMKAFAHQFPKRIGRKMRFIPETGYNIDAVMREHGYQKQGGAEYQTLWMDLTQNQEELRANLKKNWRGMLNRAEKEDVHIAIENHAAHLKECLQLYATDKIEKGYDGPHVETLIALAKTFAPQKRMFIGRAEKNGTVLGYGLFLLHGRSATYQIGWTGPQGRGIGAQNKLLWEACLALKSKGIRDLDLGGVNEQTAKGVKQFKEGMGGELVSYAGLYS